MPPDANLRSCVGTGFIVLDVIRSTIGVCPTEKRFAGGSCGNVLTILSYFGWNTYAVGRIGDDHVGRELAEDLAKWGVDTKLLRVEPGRRTPIVVQENYLDPKGRPRHRFSRACPACGATLPPYRPLLASEAAEVAAKVPSHSVFYFDRVAPGTLELARKSRASGALVVFEPSGIKDERLFTECLRASHIIKYSDDRIQGIHDLAATTKVPIEIETLGAKGLRLRVRSNDGSGAWMELPAFSAPQLRDAAGAGDWTTAGLIHGLMSEAHSPVEAVAESETVVRATRRGQALAALNCGFEGARGLMYVAEAERILESVEDIVKGTREPSTLGLEAMKSVDERGVDQACLACAGARALHA